MHLSVPHGARPPYQISVVFLAIAVGCGSWLTACGRDTTADTAKGSGTVSSAGAKTPRSDHTPPRSPTKSSTRAVTPSSSAAPSIFGEAVAVHCGGRPSAEQIVALLRRASLVPAGIRATVTTGPLCAGTWQYSIVSVPDLDPLTVISEGAPGSLTIVTAGTNVCVARVRAGAPVGILRLISC